ncbi:MAG: site-specific integrase [Candidatus Sulfotelmatobacter sp.]
MSIYKRGCDKKGPDGTCSKCGERGSCGVYWYKFMWNGTLVRESTKQGNDKVARQMEAAHKTSLAKGEVGLREKKAVPTLTEFCRKRFAPWAESTSSLKTWRDFYRVGLMAIEAYSPLASLTLDAITTERIADFGSHRQAQGMKVTTVNASLRILRRVLRVAEEWGEMEKSPKVRMLPGELHRERVITPEEEARYLASANSLLSEIATVLVDTGLRPEECYRLVWDSITWVNGRNGTLLVTHGKTKAARRVMPMTPRVRHILETRWKASGMPAEGFVWAAPTKSGHIEPSSLKKQHSKALRLCKVRPFVLYSLRHTFLTRLGQSGCDVWTLARIAGHSSIAISARYVHPSEDAVLDAMARLGGHKTGHSAKLASREEGGEPALTA